MQRHLLFAFVFSLLGVLSANAQNERDRAVLSDRDEFSKDSGWLYERLDLAMAKAAESQRPLMIVFR